MTPDELETLILESSDIPKLRRALAPLDERERAKLSTTAQKLHRALYHNKAGPGASERLLSFLGKRPLDFWRNWNSQANQHAVLALFALGPLSALKKQEIRVWGEGPTALDGILRDRRPDWLDDWVAFDLDREASQLAFPVLRGWIRDGVCRKPTVDGYYRMFAWFLMRTGFQQRGEIVPPISVQMLEDPGLFADVEGLFRVESNAFNTNAWLTKGAAPDYETWTEALIKLSAAGHLDRQALLDQALEGLTRDLKQNQLSGFHAFYKRMVPTAEESVQRQPAYIDLLRHPVGHVAKFAVEMLADLEKKGGLDTEAVLREIPVVFSNEAKGNAIAALKLVNRVLARQKTEPRQALGVACEALRHANPDVQALALDIVEARAGSLDDDQLDALRSAEPFLAASNRPRLSKLIQGLTPVAEAAAPVSAMEAEHLDYRPASADLGDNSILSTEDAITPLASIDALIEALLHAIEVVDSPDEVERIIDAISRLAHDRPADLDARLAPLLHRLKAGPKSSNSIIVGAGGVGLVLLDLLHTWVTGRLHRTPSRHSEYYTLEEAFAPTATHLRDLAERVARRQGRLLLSAATHRGGWIDPLVWIERLRAVQAMPGIVESMDFRLSLLRLAPDNRPAARERAAALALPLRRIALFALGGGARPERSDRANAAAWITAARCHDPYKDWSADLALFGLADDLPDAIRPARYDWRAFHQLNRHENHSWKLPEFKVTVVCDGEPVSPQGLGGLLGRLGLVTNRATTDWKALPTAALNRNFQAKTYWSGDLNTPWMSLWLAYVWPQNPAASHMKGAVRLVQRVDENSSGWTPTFGYFHALFQRGRPWREPGHLLLCLGLVSKDADARGLAVDAAIEGIEAGRLVPALFVATMRRLAEGEWLKFNRLGDALMLVAQASGLHALVVSQVLQAWLPTLDLQQKSAFRLLEVLVETQAMTLQPLGMDVRDALSRVAGGGKAARIAKQLLGA